MEEIQRFTSGDPEPGDDLSRTPSRRRGTLCPRALSRVRQVHVARCVGRSSWGACSTPLGSLSGCSAFGVSRYPTARRADERRSPAGCDRPDYRGQRLPASISDSGEEIPAVAPDLAMSHSLVVLLGRPRWPAVPSSGQNAIEWMFRECPFVICRDLSTCRHGVQDLRNPPRTCSGQLLAVLAERQVRLYPTSRTPSASLKATGSRLVTSQMRIPLVTTRRQPPAVRAEDRSTRYKATGVSAGALSRPVSAS